MSARAFRIGSTTIPRGTTRDVRLKISETYTGDEVAIPIRVVRARKPGPTVFVSAALHGDEVNGTGIIHEFMHGDAPTLRCGTLLLIPVVNVFGFEGNERYLPDRRDLNRSFPGSATGSLASRVAATIFEEVVRRCDYGIDLHSAALQRTNFPNVRGDLGDPEVKRLAHAFGCELIVDNKGPVGSLRREACRVGCPTIILEAGEAWKCEPGVFDLGTRGLRNSLIELGLLSGEPDRPPLQIEIRKTNWVRATAGGMLRFHAAPGDFVEKGQPLATNFSIMGEEQNILRAPGDCMVLGMTTMPAVKPGEPVCHLARISRQAAKTKRALRQRSPDSLHRQVKSDLASSVNVVSA